MRYASAIPIGVYNNRTSDKAEKNFQQAINNEIIKAQIYGVLKNATKTVAEGEQKKVFLMPLGTGVFHYDKEKAFREYVTQVKEATSILTKKELALLDIQVLAWKGLGDEESQKEMNFLEKNLRENKSLKDIITR